MYNYVLNALEWQNALNLNGSHLKDQQALFSNSSTVLPVRRRNSYHKMGSMFYGTVVAQLSMMLHIWAMQGKLHLEQLYF
jgi:hypothetical protein